jgi:hypothetical protein
MLRTCWRQLFQRRSINPRKSGRGKPTRHRPGIEMLEDRRLLSTVSNGINLSRTFLAS